ncbi:MAB_1171c family putative transporter [Streptomyces sp. HMX112]|uniref:MAB_1171c family putative transporter n=1 Tax=Streptomyces sp. HMX112 TaxID=3390850 RepID=UPI003A7F8CE0
MNLYDVLAHICTLAGLAAFCYRLPELTQRRTDPALWALAVYFLGSGFSFLIDLNWLRDHISGFFSYPNLTTIMAQSAVVILTAAQQVVLVHWSHPPEQAAIQARRRVVAFSVTLVALIAFFFLVEPYRTPPSAEGTLLSNMRDADYASYLLFYITICAVGQVGTVRLSFRYARMARRTWLRVGMWAVTVGASLILVYCAIRYTQTIGTQLGHDMSAWEPAYWLAGDLGSLSQLFGWTVPSWGPAVALWVGNYRSYLRLRPLWWALYEAVPTIALEPPRGKWLDRLPPYNLEYRLYRRVIEIFDGYLALRPHLSHAAARQGGPPDRVRRSPDDEARFLRAALEARAEETAATPPAFEPTPASPLAERRDDFAKEVEWLTEVATSFARISPPGRSAARK